MLEVFVVSGGTGKTAERMARAALIQFENVPATLVRRENVRSLDEVRRIVAEARDRRALILHTLVAEDARREMLSEARLNGVDAVDMLGPVLDHLAEHLKLVPLGKPGLLAHSAAAKTREIEAVEFAFNHDDGRNVAELGRAELVLTGVSRTMKTPTTLYLAYRGWFAANVPLIAGINPPAELLSLPADRVFYLTMDIDRLAELRRVRADRDGISDQAYAAMEHVREELRFGQRLATRQGWRKINVSGKSVEEVSREIILLASGEQGA
jgi:regulator of PEP synthase PpsR (kinase-PPPase family)